MKCKAEKRENATFTGGTERIQGGVQRGPLIITEILSNENRSTRGDCYLTLLLLVPAKI